MYNTGLGFADVDASGNIISPDLSSLPSYQAVLDYAAAHPGDVGAPSPSPLAAGGFSMSSVSSMLSGNGLLIAGGVLLLIVLANAGGKRR